MTLGRFGGDEFIVLMDEGNVEEAKEFADLLIDEFSHTVEDLDLPKVKTELGISVGIAMYNSKAKGNNHITILD